MIQTTRYGSKSKYQAISTMRMTGVPLRCRCSRYGDGEDEALAWATGPSCLEVDFGLQFSPKEFIP